jgi:hypothetical protein
MNSYIATPAETPNIGDFFEGGYYTGMIWNQLAQSSTLMAIEIGIKSFIVPDMDSSPIVYMGQQLEIRSRSNPNNKFVGYVTNALDMKLTVNVTTISGEGTFNDWSVMARYRILVAPKASGEHKSIALKNTNTKLPIGCQSLNDGWFSTNAMTHAGDTETYPAAWWARSLVINGHDDWYIPARDELELCWRNLKPTIHNNYATADRLHSQYEEINYKNNGLLDDWSTAHGMNNNSDPIGSAYTCEVPRKTNIIAFQVGGLEAFAENSYWSSTEFSNFYEWVHFYGSGAPGFQDFLNKFTPCYVRVVRRSII